MPITLSDEEIVSVTRWVHGREELPDALRRVVAQSTEARRRLFVPTTLHLIILEPLYLIHIHCTHCIHPPCPIPGVPLRPDPTVRELDDLGLIGASEPRLPEFPDGLWRITDEGVSAYGRIRR